MLLLPSGCQIQNCSSTSLSPQAIAVKATYIEQSLQAIGISLPCGSRFYEYSQIVRACAGECDKAFPKDKTRIAETYLNSVREIHELYLILEMLRESLEEPAVRERIERTISDPLLMKDQNIHTPGRDSQAELYIAARCVMGGLNVDFQEPDLIVSCPTGDLGVAVKRVKSHAKVERNIRNAGRQIQKSGIDGFICLDLTSLYERNDGILWDYDLGRLAEWNEHEFLPRWDPWVPKLMAAVRAEKCLGFFTMGHLLAVRPVNEEVIGNQTLQECLVAAHEVWHTSGFNFISTSDSRFEKLRAFERAFTGMSMPPNPTYDYSLWPKHLLGPPPPWGKAEISPIFDMKTMSGAAPT